MYINKRLIRTGCLCSYASKHRLKLLAWLTLVAPFLFLLVWVSACGEASETTISISDITVSVAGGRALIEWSTDRQADSRVEYGVTTSYGMEAIDTALKTQHIIELTALQLHTTYYFRIQSMDASGAGDQTRDFSFATLAEGEVAPQPSEVEALARIDSAIIMWQTNESATGEIEYGEDVAYGSSAISSEAQIEHEALLTDLKSETTYHYRIKVTDLDGNITFSSDFTFETESEPEESISRKNITARKWEFSPAAIQVAEGDKVVLTIRSTDVPHGFGLAAFGINEVINPGQDVVVEFTADRKGTHSFICTVQCGAGHGDMKGTLTVE